MSGQGHTAGDLPTEVKLRTRSRMLAKLRHTYTPSSVPGTPTMATTSSSQQKQQRDAAGYTQPAQQGDRLQQYEAMGTGADQSGVLLTAAWTPNEPPGQSTSTSPLAHHHEIDQAQVTACNETRRDAPDTLAESRIGTLQRPFAGLTGQHQTQPQSGLWPRLDEGVTPAAGMLMGALTDIAAGLSSSAFLETEQELVDVHADSSLASAQPLPPKERFKAFGAWTPGSASAPASPLPVQNNTLPASLPGSSTAPPSPQMAVSAATPHRPYSSAGNCIFTQPPDQPLQTGGTAVSASPKVPHPMPSAKFMLPTSPHRVSGPARMTHGSHTPHSYSHNLPPGPDTDPAIDAGHIRQAHIPQGMAATVVASSGAAGEAEQAHVGVLGTQALPGLLQPAVQQLQQPLSLQSLPFMPGSITGYQHQSTESLTGAAFSYTIPDAMPAVHGGAGETPCILHEDMTHGSHLHARLINTSEHMDTAGAALAFLAPMHADASPTSSGCSMQLCTPPAVAPEKVKELQGSTGYGLAFQADSDSSSSSSTTWAGYVATSLKRNWPPRGLWFDVSQHRLQGHLLHVSNVLLHALYLRRDDVMRLAHAQAFWERHHLLLQLTRGVLVLVPSTCMSHRGLVADEYHAMHDAAHVQALATAGVNNPNELLREAGQPGSVDTRSEAASEDPAAKAEGGVGYVLCRVVGLELRDVDSVVNGAESREKEASDQHSYPRLRLCPVLPNSSTASSSNTTGASTNTHAEATSLSNSSRQSAQFDVDVSVLCDEPLSQLLTHGSLQPWLSTGSSAESSASNAACLCAEEVVEASMRLRLHPQCLPHMKVLHHLKAELYRPSDPTTYYVWKEAGQPVYDQIAAIFDCSVEEKVRGVLGEVKRQMLAQAMQQVIEQAAAAAANEAAVLAAAAAPGVDAKLTHGSVLADAHMQEAGAASTGLEACAVNVVPPVTIGSVHIQRIDGTAPAAAGQGAATSTTVSEGLSASEHGMQMVGPAVEASKAAIAAPESGSRRHSKRSALGSSLGSKSHSRSRSDSASKAAKDDPAQTNAPASDPALAAAAAAAAACGSTVAADMCVKPPAVPGASSRSRCSRSQRDGEDAPAAGTSLVVTSRLTSAAGNGESLTVGQGADIANAGKGSGDSQGSQAHTQSTAPAPASPAWARNRSAATHRETLTNGSPQGTSLLDSAEMLSPPPPLLSLSSMARALSRDLMPPPKPRQGSGSSSSRQNSRGVTVSPAAALPSAENAASAVAGRPIRSVLPMKLSSAGGSSPKPVAESSLSPKKVKAAIPVVVIRQPASVSPRTAAAAGDRTKSRTRSAVQSGSHAAAAAAASAASAAGGVACTDEAQGDSTAALAPAFAEHTLAPCMQEIGSSPPPLPPSPPLPPPPPLPLPPNQAGAGAEPLGETSPPLTNQVDATGCLQGIACPPLPEQAELTQRHKGSASRAPALQAAGSQAGPVEGSAPEPPSPNMPSTQTNQHSNHSHSRSHSRKRHSSKQRGGREGQRRRTHTRSPGRSSSRSRSHRPVRSKSRSRSVLRSRSRSRSRSHARLDLYGRARSASRSHSRSRSPLPPPRCWQHAAARIQGQDACKTVFGRDCRGVDEYNRHVYGTSSREYNSISGNNNGGNGIGGSGRDYDARRGHGGAAWGVLGNEEDNQRVEESPSEVLRLSRLYDEALYGYLMVHEEGRTLAQIRVAVPIPRGLLASCKQRPSTYLLRRPHLFCQDFVTRNKYDSRFKANPRAKAEMQQRIAKAEARRAKGLSPSCSSGSRSGVSGDSSSQPDSSIAPGQSSQADDSDKKNTHQTLPSVQTAAALREVYSAPNTERPRPLSKGRGRHSRSRSRSHGRGNKAQLRSSSKDRSLRKRQGQLSSRSESEGRLVGSRGRSRLSLSEDNADVSAGGKDIGGKRYTRSTQRGERHHVPDSDSSSTRASGSSSSSSGNIRIGQEDDSLSPGAADAVEAASACTGQGRRDQRKRPLTSTTAGTAGKDQDVVPGRSGNKVSSKRVRVDITEGKSTQTQVSPLLSKEAAPSTAKVSSAVKESCTDQVQQATDDMQSPYQRILQVAANMALGGHEGTISQLNALSAPSYHAHAPLSTGRGLVSSTTLPNPAASATEKAAALAARLVAAHVHEQQQGR